MNVRTRSRLAWSAALGSIAITALWVILGFVWAISDQPALAFLTLAIVIAIAPVGATIAAKTGNPVGWALLAVLGAVSVNLAADAYATYALAIAERPLPLAALAALVGNLSFFLSLVLFVAVPLLYPTGTPRWRWLWRAYVAATITMVVGFTILPGDLSLNGGQSLANPYAIDALKKPVGVILALAGVTISASVLLSIVALILRFRESRGDERQQIRWLAYVGVTFLILFVAGLILGSAFGGNDTVENVIAFVAFGTALLGIPAACAIAILKYHLYDLDIVIRKAVVFGLLAVFITAVYAGIVGGVGALAKSSGSTTLSFVAAAALAVLFQPARDRARKVADRLVYGKRATPYEVLAEFSGRVSETYASDDVLPRMATVLAEGTGAESAVVWLRVGAEMRPASVQPHGAATPESLPEDAVEVRHQGELLGALSVEMPPADPMNPAKDKLVRDLASQAGVVLRNVRLIEELRASRQRLVEAQDEERRKIERNLHDGAQQQLVALSVQLRIADSMVGRDTDKEHELLASVQAAATGALEDLRDLARGIYPPLLADKGLPTALEAQARKSPVPVDVIAEQVGRYPQEIEAAVYFSCLEALQNVAKYARASAASIRLLADDGSLRFEVEDDGAGFDPVSTGYGTGLQGMADRLDAVGGALEVRSAPGEGTTVTGRVPARTILPVT